jgi:hypothetical protein
MRGTTVAPAGREWSGRKASNDLGGASPAIAVDSGLFPVRFAPQ